MTRSELAAKHAAQGVTVQIVEDLRAAMSQCWGTISDDIEDYDETIALYKKRGETGAKHSCIWEARCVAEMTIDAGRLEQYGFRTYCDPKPTEIPQWWKDLLARNGKDWSIIDFGAEVWLATR